MIDSFTTDGSHPSFYENGMTNVMISTAIKQGVPVIDAYDMASYNIARYYNMEHVHGSIATGRIANINILESKKTQYQSVSLQREMGEA